MSHIVSRTQWIQLTAISAVALALYAGFRLLPTGTNLSHMDFRVSGSNSIEFCDPSNPQFIPVVAVRSPVTMTLTSVLPPLAGTDVSVRLQLATSSGKPLGPTDLVLAHTRKLHLLIIDPSLQDYQHVHPEPTRTPGEWIFSFQPRAGGVYRVFADFTPAATNRGLYASADLKVDGAPLAMAVRVADAGVQDQGDYRFSLVSGNQTIRAGSPVDLEFTVTRKDGGSVRLELVMDAYAHLVAFDEPRGGFAHLHPTDLDPNAELNPQRPSLSFKLTIPSSGRYVIWAQVGIDGRELFVPFWLSVVD